MRRIVLATTALAVLTLAVPAMAQTPADPVVAVVNGTQLHKSDIEAAFESLPEQYRQMPLELIYDPLLDRVIDSQLLLTAADKAGLADDPEVQGADRHARATTCCATGWSSRRSRRAPPTRSCKAAYEAMKSQPDFAFTETHAAHILVADEAEAEGDHQAARGRGRFHEARQREVDRSLGQDQWRRSRLLPQGGHGAGVRGGRVRDRARQDRHDAGEVAVRLARDQGDRAAPDRADLRGEGAGAARAAGAADRQRPADRRPHRRHDRAVQPRRHAQDRDTAERRRPRRQRGTGRSKGLGSERSAWPRSRSARRWRPSGFPSIPPVPGVRFATLDAGHPLPQPPRPDPDRGAPPAAPSPACSRARPRPATRSVVPRDPAARAGRGRSSSMPATPTCSGAARATPPCGPRPRRWRRRSAAGPEEVFVASTGVIGERLPVEKITARVAEARRRPAGRRHRGGGAGRS